MHTSTNELISMDLTEIDFERRFGGIARLYGAPALARFRAAHVCVIGVGGVGSWIVEALARSAIGRLTLIDLDNVAESNINRQIQAMSDTIGKAKITALAERIELINPLCQVTQIEDFITPDNLEQLLGGRDFDYLVDAIDNAKAKGGRDRVLPRAQCPHADHRQRGRADGPDPDRRARFVENGAGTTAQACTKTVAHRIWFPPWREKQIQCRRRVSMEPLSTPESAEACASMAARPPASRASIAPASVPAWMVTASFGMGGGRPCAEKLAPAWVPQTCRTLSKALSPFWQHQFFLRAGSGRGKV